MIRDSVMGLMLFDIVLNCWNCLLVLFMFDVGELLVNVFVGSDDF